MTDEKFEQLVRDYPIIFQKSGDIDFAINDGWYTIIDTLLFLLTRNYYSISSRLKYALENPDSKSMASIEQMEEQIKSEYEKLPTIEQVKEKYGTLRFYVDGGTSEMHNYIDFAESISGHMCEVCGAPGERRNSGWVKTLCNNHHKQKETTDFVGSLT